MKKAYYYFLFRMYLYHKNVLNDKGNLSLTVCMSSTVFLFFNLLTVFAFLEYKDVIDFPIYGNFTISIAIGIIAIINYYLFIKMRNT